LRILWSCSSSFSAELLDDIKKGQDEPVPEEAQSKGITEATPSSQIIFSPIPQAMIRCFPGITHANETSIMREFTSIYDIVQAFKSLSVPKGFTSDSANKFTSFVKHDPVG
jgi:DNA excision repair protein ERCC-4